MQNSSAPTRNIIVSVPMFWSTGNHWGLQEDIHYCPNVTCWCVNCQLICMQKLHQFPVCFIYEEILQIDMSTGPNAVDVSTVSLMHLWTVPSLLHIWREHTDRPVNLSQCWWYVNCQHICQQKMHLWTVPSLLHIWREYVCRRTCQLVPMLLLCQLSAYFTRVFHMAKKSNHYLP